MGARINYVFKDREDHGVVLYSHWGETEWQRDIAMALQHAKPRWDDSSYGTRMMISYLIQDCVLDETGFGIYAITDVSCLHPAGDPVVIIDFANKTITDTVPVDWDAFINAYAPNSLTETVVGQGNPPHMEWGQVCGGLDPFHTF